MGNLEWFYIQSWQRKEAQYLKEHGTILVEWDIKEGEESPPKIITLPEGFLDGIDAYRVINNRVSNYLTDAYGCIPSEWNIYRGDV